MQIRDLGEFGLIERLNGMVTRDRRGPDNGAVHGFQLLVDTGDDTAAWSAAPATELFTTDTVVEGIHFTRETTPWHDLGWKSLASNISDIAAMGGLPLYALITLGLPPETGVADIEDLYRGMLEIGEEYGVAIIGGDMVGSPVAFITVALTGVRSGSPMLRTGARVGDRVAVTGYVGSSGGGLKLMLEGLEVPGKSAEYLREAHRRPRPAVAEGQLLSRAGVLTAMDVSDGLGDDLSKLCLASGVSARIFADNVPMHPALLGVFPRRLPGPGPERRGGLSAALHRAGGDYAGSYSRVAGGRGDDRADYRRGTRPDYAGGNRRGRNGHRTGGLGSLQSR